MDEMLTRLWENLGGRIGGPMKLRLLIQPLMAILFAIRAGVKDARAGRPPFFWTVLSNAQARSELLRDGWKDVAKVFTMAVVIDVVYQLIVERWVYPLESLIVAIVLAGIPYLALRGPVNRIVRAVNPVPPPAPPVKSPEVTAELIDPRR